MAKLLLKATLFLAGLVAVSAALHRVDAVGGVEVAGEKLVRFRAIKDEVDTVFVGSSYVYREVAPSHFDATTAALGAPTRSFNFGVPGMDPPETYYVVERVLAERPARLRWVVVELDYYRELVRERNLHTRRFDYWHDLATTLEVSRATLAAEAGVGKRVKDVGTHVEAFARRLLNVGRGPGMLAVVAGDAPAPSSLGRSLDGFRSLDEEQSSTYAARRQIFDAFEGDRLEEKVAVLRGEAAAEGAGPGISAIDEEALRRMIRMVREAGATPVLIVPPCLAPRADLIALARERLGAEVLPFNSPDLYPRLYEPEYRYDLGHLNERGALEFTTLLARRLHELGAR